jgi:hypothetical protein
VLVTRWLPRTSVSALRNRSGVTWTNDQPLEALGYVDLVRLRARPRHTRAPLDLRLELLPHRLDRNIHLLKEPGNEASLLLEERQHQVLAIDLPLAVANSDPLRLLESLLALFCESTQVQTLNLRISRPQRRLGSVPAPPARMPKS